MRHLAHSVSYSVVPINFSLLTTTLYSPVITTLAYNDTKSFHDVITGLLCNSHIMFRKHQIHEYIFTGPGWFIRYSNSLRAGRSGDRIPVGARFSASVETGPGTHPASCTTGKQVSLPLVKCLGRRVDFPPPYSAQVKEGVDLYL